MKILGEKNAEKKCRSLCILAGQVNCIQSHLSSNDLFNSPLNIKYCKRISLFLLHALSQLDNLSIGST